MPHSHLQLMIRHMHMCTSEWLITVRSASSIFRTRKRKRSVPVMLKAKLKWTIPRAFHDYWWLFRMLHVSRYSAWLAEEEEEKEEEEEER